MQIIMSPLNGTVQIAGSRCNRSYYLYLSYLKSEVLGQSKQTGPYVSDSPGQFAHVLPALHAGIKPVDESRLTVIVLAVSSQNVELLLQDS